MLVDHTHHQAVVASLPQVLPQPDYCMDGVGTATLQVVETNSAGCVGDPVSIVVQPDTDRKRSIHLFHLCGYTGYHYSHTRRSGHLWLCLDRAGMSDQPGQCSQLRFSVAGTYTVVITNTATTCTSAPASGTVTINAAPVLVINNPHRYVRRQRWILPRLPSPAGSTAVRPLLD